jgi:hypothetical protein
MKHLEQEFTKPLGATVLSRNHHIRMRLDNNKITFTSTSASFRLFSFVCLSSNVEKFE